MGGDLQEEDINEAAHGWYLCENERGGGKRRKQKTKPLSMGSEDTPESIAPVLGASLELNESHEANHSLSHHHLP